MLVPPLAIITVFSLSFIFMQSHMIASRKTTSNATSKSVHARNNHQVLNEDNFPTLPSAVPSETPAAGAVASPQTPSMPSSSLQSASPNNQHAQSKIKALSDDVKHGTEQVHIETNKNSSDR